LRAGKQAASAFILRRSGDENQHSNPQTDVPGDWGNARRERADGMLDDNIVQIADLLSEFLKRKGLDKRD
jgi:hypothetical protein